MAVGDGYVFSSGGDVGVGDEVGAVVVFFLLGFFHVVELVDFAEAGFDPDTAGAGVQHRAGDGYRVEHGSLFAEHRAEAGPHCFVGELPVCGWSIHGCDLTHFFHRVVDRFEA